MILRLSDSLARGVVVAAALAVGLWLSFFGIRSAMARYGAEGDDVQRLGLAVRLEPGNPAYWYLLGRYYQYNLEQPDSALAEEAYRRATALNPLATDAWLDLGTAYELEGNSAEASKAYLQAKKSYPSSADVSWRYGNFLLRSGDRAMAYAELRRAIEADPTRAAAAFSRAYRSNPDIREIIEQLLPAKPSVYVAVIAEAAGAGQLAVAQTVWTELMKLHPLLTMVDFDRFVLDLLQAGEFREARQIWDEGTATMGLPPLFRPPESEVWDPSFESGVNERAFSWGFATKVVEGVSISLDRAEKHSGFQALRLSFDGKNNPGMDLACTLAIVQPGTAYSFSGWVKTKNITTSSGISFWVRSYDDRQAPIVSTSEVHGTTPWTSVEETWTAGSATHRALVCVRREASDNPEVRISGMAWVDDVNLVAQPTERRRPQHQATEPHRP